MSTKATTTKVTTTKAPTTTTPTTKTPKPIEGKAISLNELISKSNYAEKGTLVDKAFRARAISERDLETIEKTAV